MVERESVIDIATVRLHSMEARFAKAKDFWKSHAMKNPVPRPTLAAIFKSLAKHSTRHLLTMCMK